MEDAEIITRFKNALAKLIEKDRWLLDHDLSEPSISHKFAIYLQELFNDYNVDCEYNGNVDHESGRKHIKMLFEELNKMGLLKEKEAEIDNEFIQRAVFPDIIVHSRGNNEHNLCIVEVKKNTSSISQDYDYLKIRAYTGQLYGNTLIYQLGILVLFHIGDQAKPFTLLYFKNGEQIV